jgi:transcription initiation factor TFIIIB Brf1 subunit/transcription initiation factor TFIIB
MNDDTPRNPVFDRSTTELHPCLLSPESSIAGDNSERVGFSERDQDAKESIAEIEYGPEWEAFYGEDSTAVRQVGAPNTERGLRATLRCARQLASALDMSQTTKRFSRQLIVDADKRGVHTDRAPVEIAAAGLCAAACLTNEPLSLDTVADAMDVNPDAIQACYQDLVERAAVRDDILR